MSAVSVTLAIMFVALAVSNNIKVNKPTPPPPQSNTTIELHKPVGTVFEYNPVTKKIDTVVIYRKK